MHPITAALEKSMAPDRIDPSKYKATHVIKPAGYYQDDAILIGGVWYNARTGWKINAPVKIIIHLHRNLIYNQFHEHPDSNEQG